MHQFCAPKLVPKSNPMLQFSISALSLVCQNFTITRKFKVQSPYSLEALRKSTIVEDNSNFSPLTLE